MPSFQYYTRQFRILPFHEVVRRAVAVAKQLSRDQIGKVRAHIFGTGISDEKFLERAFGRRFPNHKAAAHFRARTKPFFFGSDGAAAALSHLPEDERAAIISRALKICSHTFDLLGSGEVLLGPEIDWHCDSKTGYRWNPRTYCKDIKIPYGKADIKAPWELSRFAHAVTLGQAYCLTKDEKYAREFWAQVGDWIDRNQPQFGVNWACTMDVAIRVCNWMAGYSFFRNSPSLDDTFLLKFLKSLYQHGLHIRANLEYTKALTSNHYLANITGLIYLGVQFPEFGEAAEWMDFGIRELVREMGKQIYADGCDFEASTCYHRLVLEFFFYSTLVVVVNDADFSGNNHREVAEKIFGMGYANKLYSMFNAVLHLLKPDGRMPQIGDNDSGMLHVFARREILDMRYLLTLGAVFFKESRFKVREFGFCEEAAWVFGAIGIESWRELRDCLVRDVKSKAFPDAGWFVIRNDRDYAVISCGPNGQNGNGGHAHNDKLSFELVLGGEDFIVDPGIFVYTPSPADRNFSRSTRSHNTVSMAGLEQNRIPEGPLGLFYLLNDARAKALSWETSSEHDHLSAEHHGYQSENVVHRRQFDFFKTTGMLIILDELLGKTGSAGTAHFHFAPGKEIRSNGNHVYEVSRARLVFNGAIFVEQADYFFSPAYGVRMPARMLTVHFRDRLRTEISKKHV